MVQRVRREQCKAMDVCSGQILRRLAQRSEVYYISLNTRMDNDLPPSFIQITTIQSTETTGSFAISTDHPRLEKSVTLISMTSHRARRKMAMPTISLHHAFLLNSIGLVSRLSFQSHRRIWNFFKELTKYTHSTQPDKLDKPGFGFGYVKYSAVSPPNWIQKFSFRTQFK